MTGGIDRRSAILLALGGLLLVAAFLPWWSYQTGTTVQTQGGVDYAGVLAIGPAMLAFALALFGIGHITDFLRPGGTLVGIVVVALGVIFINSSGDANAFFRGLGVSYTAAPQVGLYLQIPLGVAVVVASSVPFPDLGGSKRPVSQPVGQEPASTASDVVLEAHYSMRLSEVVLALARVRLGSRVLVLLGIGWGLFILLGIPNADGADVRGTVIANLAVAAFLASGYFWVPFARIVMSGQVRAFSAPVDVHITEENVRMKSGAVDSVVGWTAFRSARESGQVFLLRLASARRDVLIPARGFGDRVDLFRDLLARKGLSAR